MLSQNSLDQKNINFQKQEEISKFLLKYFLLFFIFFISSCTNSQIKKSQEVNTNEVNVSGKSEPKITKASDTAMVKCNIDLNIKSIEAKQSENINITKSNLSDISEDLSIDIFVVEQNNSELQLEVWTDKCDYQIGEDVDFYIKTNKDCYITMIERIPNGKVYSIFPNKYSKNNLIKADNLNRLSGEDYDYKLKVKGPSGIEFIKIIASTEPVELIKIKFDSTTASSYELDLKNENVYRGLTDISLKLDKTIWIDTIISFNILEETKPNISSETEKK